MPKLSGLRERLQIEHESIPVRVRLGDQHQIENGWHETFHFENNSERAYILKALRLDAIHEQAPALSFARLLAGLRVEVTVGEKPFGTMTFSRGLLNGQSPVADIADMPHMQHAVVGPLGKDIYIASKQNFSIRLTYEGPNVAVSFLRVVDLGIGERDVPEDE